MIFLVISNMALAFCGLWLWYRVRSLDKEVDIFVGKLVKLALAFGVKSCGDADGESE